MRMLGSIFRVLLGFAFACLIAGAATVAFVITPADVAALSPDARPERLSNAGVLALLAATHSAIFSFPFALIAIVLGEWLRLRSWIYYVIAGIVIALGGFGAVSYFEVDGQPTIVNDYAMRAFLTVGALGGLAYWLVAGRKAGRGEQAAPAMPEAPEAKEPPADDEVAEAAN